MSRRSVGDLRHRITLEAVQRTPDGGGGGLESWTAVADIWASITPLQGNEIVAADTTAGRITHTIITRWRADIAPAMRFRYAARLFEIEAVIDIDERRRHLRCACRERDL